MTSDQDMIVSEERLRELAENPVHLEGFPQFRKAVEIQAMATELLALRSNLKEQPVAVPAGWISGDGAMKLALGSPAVIDPREDPAYDVTIPLYASPPSPVSRESVIEECARVADRWAKKLLPPEDARHAPADIAADIRSLSPTDKGEVGK